MSRVTVIRSWRQLSLPRLELIVDGTYVALCFTIELRGADPALLVELNLTGTRTGERAAAAYWWVDGRRPFRYWLRPYDQLADRRRWRWQRPAPCGRMLTPELRGAIEAAVQALDNPCVTCRGSGLLPPTGLQPDGWAEGVEYTDPPPCPDCGGSGAVFHVKQRTP